MSSPDDPVALEWAPNPWLADLWVKMLVDGGIPAYTEGGNLVDENAFAQKLLGALGQTVYVRRRDVEAAREMLVEIRRDAAKSPSGDGDLEAEEGKESSG